MRGGCGAWGIEQEAGVRVGDSQLGESSDDHASSDDGEVGSQRASASESAECSEVLFDPREKDFGDQIVSGFGSDLDVSGGCRVVDDVDDQGQEAVGELLPGSGVLSEALVEQFAIEVGECHGIAGKRGRTNPSRGSDSVAGELLNIR